MRRPLPPFVLLLTLLTAPPVWAAADAAPAFDFTQPTTAAGWKPAHDVARLRPTSEGLAIDIGGADPYLHGPAADFPSGVPLRMYVRLKTEQAGTGQLYYFRDHPTEAQSVRFDVPAGGWTSASSVEPREVWADVPPLGSGYRLRLDPPGTGGTVVVARLWFEPFSPYPFPEWPAVARPVLRDDSPAVRSGAVELRHDGKTLGAFEVRIDGEPMAVGLARSKIGYVVGGEVRWADLSPAADVKVDAGGLDESAAVTDADGSTWTIRRRYAPAAAGGVINVKTNVAVDRDRDVAFLPLLFVLPGVGSFGGEKSQALFPGLEYLENEPSRSEADVIGPASHRLLPDPVKITIPLMAVAAGGRYVGLVWRPGEGEARDRFSPVFDSPDRTFGSGGHTMGLVFPGFGAGRVEGELMPGRPTRLRANEPLTLSATIVGGTGAGVVPAIQDYVRLRGLPPTPPVMGEDGAKAYFSLAAAGWLDSDIRIGDRYRHATPGAFRPQPAADAAVMQDWLAGQVTDANTADRLRAAAKAAIAQVEPANYDAAAVGHVRYPLQSLVYGHVAKNADRAAARGRALLARFEPDGSVRYKPQPGKPDYGRTHYAPDANGLTATVVTSLLEYAAVSGDPDLLREGVRVLRAMDKFRGGVPRGAQTWECPLHIPDVLASAFLVRAYTLGYELTGEVDFLDSARYWAWTGVPFVYLTDPAGGIVGTYASISVFGATNWEAPVWMGQPVQWTALVYADALYRLLPHDPAGPWRQLADGITASGIRQTHPLGSSRQGLLPDSFVLRTGARNDPAINPGTAFMPAVCLFGRPEVYSFHSFRRAKLLVHAPGPLGDVKEDEKGVTFTVRGWPKRPYFLLVSGLAGAPQVMIDGKDTPLAGPHRYVEGKGRLILQLEGQPLVEIRPWNR